MCITYITKYLAIISYIGCFNNLTILDEIGRGSFGVDYKAVWREVVVAVKVVQTAKKNSYSMLMSEIEAIK